MAAENTQRAPKRQRLDHELSPLHRHRFVPAADVVAMFRGAPSIDSAQFRQDLDAVVDQDPTPR